jgi:hypothetical protein
MICPNFKKFRLLVLSVGCLAGFALLSSGCKPHVADVTVTIKAAEGAAADGETETAEQPTAEVGFGDLTGDVLFDGDAPEAVLLVKKGDGVKDADVCSAEDVPNESLEVNPQSKGIKNVFVYLEKAPAGAKIEEPAGEVIFDQKVCRFLPHCLLMRTKQTVLVLSGDSVAHNTHTSPTRNSQFNSTISPNERKGVALVYGKAETKPVGVVCDYHSWMKAYHLPLDHPFAAITDENGKFEIKGIPAGTHQFRVWHERGEFLERALKVTVKADSNEPLSIKVAASKFK